MGTIRRKPYGYKMEFGEVVFQEETVEVVKWIFRTYQAGASYKELTDRLRERGVPYEAERNWNKNIVARILADGRYTGKDGFPQIIPRELFECVQEQRKSRTTPTKKTPAQKELRKLCGGNPPAYVEGQVLGVLNRLIQCPELIQTPESEQSESPVCRRTRGELNDLLRTPPVDEARAKELAFRIVTLRMEEIGPEAYETDRLRRQFRNREPMAELDQDLLHASVRRITYRNGRTEVLLKNNQKLTGGTER